MFVSQGLTKITVINAILTLLSILVFIWVRRSPDSRVRKFNLMMDLQNPKHLINSVVKKLESKDFESLERDAFDLNLHCYECLIVKSQHMYHCKRCDACIEYRHKHSSFIGKCIGRDNSIAYFWFILISLLLNATLTYCIAVSVTVKIEAIAGDEYKNASNFLLRIVGVLINICEQRMVFRGLALLI